MNYDLGTYLYAVDEYSDCIQHGKVSSIRYTSYKNYNSKGRPQHSLYREYNINSSWHHSDRVFTNREDAVLVLSNQIQIKINYLQERIDEL